MRIPVSVLVTGIFTALQLVFDFLPSYPRKLLSRDSTRKSLALRKTHGGEPD
jgi:hypothetical protein